MQARSGQLEADEWMAMHGRPHLRRRHLQLGYDWKVRDVTAGVTVETGHADDEEDAEDQAAKAKERRRTGRPPTCCASGAWSPSRRRRPRSSRGGQDRRSWTSVSGRGLSVWDTSSYGEPVAAPLAVVAEILAQPLALVEEAARQVEPYIRADGRPVWSVELVGIALGVRRGHAGGGGRSRRREA